MKLNLVMAVDAGFIFHENKFSGIVYGLGEIPLEWNGEELVKIYLKCLPLYIRDYKKLSHH